MGEWLLSRRDGAIVAWHEVPGTAPPKEPSRRVRSDWVGVAPIRSGVTKFRKEEYLAFLNKYDAHFDEKHLWDELRPIIPYPTGRFFRGTLSQALRATRVWTSQSVPRSGRNSGREH